MPDAEPTSRYHASMHRGFEFAHEQGRDCGPLDFLVGIADSDGPAAAALDPGQGRTLRAVAVVSGAGGGAGYLHMQAQGAAISLAGTLGQAAGPEHLLIALLDQGKAEVTQTLRAAGLEPAAVRQAALAAIGAPAGQPPVALPPLIPAGTLDRPPLPVTDLDPAAWANLCWRQEHLPLRQLRRAGDRQALYHLEAAAAWRLAGRLDLDDDHGHSLVCQHLDAVERLVADGRPDLAGQPQAPGGPANPLARLARGRRRRLPWLLNLSVGWSAWLGNRQASLRDRWFWLRTRWHYRRGPAR